MKLIASAIVLAAVCYVTAADAACSYPKAPTNVPSGETATEEQMLAAKKEVVQYNTDMTAYLDCLDAEFKEWLDAQESDMARNATATESDKRRFERSKQEASRKRDQKHDAAVEELTSIVDHFNQQVRAYKKKQAG